MGLIRRCRHLLQEAANALAEFVSRPASSSITQRHRNYKTNASPAARVALWVAHGLAAWPLWLLHGLGWGLGWLVWLTAPLYRQRWRAHTQLAGLSAAQARASIGAAGQQVLELPKVWFGPRLRYTFDGAQHIEAALADGGGLLFLTPHMGCFEATSRAKRGCIRSCTARGSGHTLSRHQRR